MKKKIFKQSTTDMIKAFLQGDPKYRNDDRALLSKVWRTEIDALRQDPVKAKKYRLYQNHGRADFFILFEAGELTNPETIRRSRAKIQEHHPELRGTNQAARDERQEQIKFELGYKTKSNG